MKYGLEPHGVYLIVEQIELFEKKRSQEEQTTLADTFIIPGQQKKEPLNNDNNGVGFYKVLSGSAENLNYINKIIAVDKAYVEIVKIGEKIYQMVSNKFIKGTLFEKKKN